MHKNFTVCGLQLPTLSASSRACVYNTAATTRQGAHPNTDDQVLKAKLPLPWTGPFRILAVGPAAAEDTPDHRPPGPNLVYLELPSGMPGSDSRARVFVHRCNSCHSFHDVNGFPPHLPADLSKYALHPFGGNCPPFNITATC